MGCLNGSHPPIQFEFSQGALLQIVRPKIDADAVIKDSNAGENLFLRQRTCICFLLEDTYLFAVMLRSALVSDCSCLILLQEAKPVLVEEASEQKILMWVQDRVGVLLEKETT